MTSAVVVDFKKDEKAGVNRAVSFDGPFLIIICEQNDELKFERLIHKYINEFYMIFRGSAGNQLVARLKKRLKRKAN